MAKAILAFEATKITHGDDAALAAWNSSQAAFGAREIDERLLPTSSIPRSKTEMNLSAIRHLYKSKLELKKGIPAFELLFEAQLVSSKAEARRIIAQGGAYVNNEQIKNFDDRWGAAPE